MPADLPIRTLPSGRACPPPDQMMLQVLVSGGLAAAVTALATWLLTVAGVHLDMPRLQVFSGFGPGAFGLVFQHVVLSLAAAFPLLVMLVLDQARRPPWLVGLAYGLGLFVLLPGAAAPALLGVDGVFQQGPATAVGIGAVHLLFGLTVALTSRDLVRRVTGA